MPRLRDFSEEHIKQDCSSLSGTHENGLFYGCKFEKLNGLSLVDCDLNASKFTTENIKDALGFTLTMACMSFRGVEFSPLLFDLFLALAAMSSGNDEKREKLKDVIGRDRATALLRVLNCVE